MATEIWDAWSVARLHPSGSVVVGVSAGEPGGVMVWFGYGLGCGAAWASVRGIGRDNVGNVGFLGWDEADGA